MKIKRLAQLSVGIGTVLALYWMTKDSFDLVTKINTVSYKWLVFSIVVAVLDRYLMAWKWTLLLEPFEAHISVLRATMIYCAAQLWGLFLPATLGADALRIMCLRREDIGVDTSSASIIAERFLGALSSLAVLAAASCMVWLRFGEQELMTVIFGAATTGLCFGAIIAYLTMGRRQYVWLQRKFLTRIPVQFAKQLLRKIHTGVYRYRKFGHLIRKFLAASVLESLISTVFFYAIFAAFGLTIPFEYLMVAMGAGFVLSRIPISLSGLGVFEGGMSFVLFQYGVPVDQSVTAALAGRILQIVVWLPFWGAYMRTYPGSTGTVNTQPEIESENTPAR